MKNATHFLFNAFTKSTKDTAITLTIKQLGKKVSTVTTTVADMMLHIESFKGDHAIDIEVHSLTTTKKGKPELVYCGVVFESPKMSLAQRIANLNSATTL